MSRIESPDNRVLQEDLERAAALDLPIEALDGSRIFVTGATGLIGSQLVKFLLCRNRICHCNTTVIIFARSKEKALKVFPYLEEEEHLEIVLGDISEPICYDGDIDYVIHGASPTSSKYFVSHPVETIGAAVDGTRYVLELAKQKQVKGVVYLSSLEVYGTPAEDAGMITEKDYGYIEPLSVRSSYSEGKRIVECLCASYAHEYSVPVKIARLSQTFGPGVAYEDGRVFAEFARCALEQRDIVLHTQGHTVRSYCYTKDALSALLYILISGKAGEAYNVTNMDTAVSIKEMAELVCETIGSGKIKTVIDIPEDLASFGYNPEMIIRLDSKKLMQLGWKATIGLEEMFERLIKGMKK